MAKKALTTQSARVASSIHIRHIPALDGLRGCAVIAVLLFHGGHLQGGYLGVDLFFVLSGFLITSLLLAEAGGQRHIGLANFWVRRARRLLPALGVMMVGVIAYATFVARPHELPRIRADGLATIFYVANWHDIVASNDYFAIFGTPSPLAHTWSLAIEEQFYLLWPLVFVAILAFDRWRSPHRNARRVATSALMVVAVLGTISAALSLNFLRNGQWNRVYYGTDTRSFAILAGAGLATLVARRGRPTAGVQRRLLEIAGIFSIGILAYAWMNLGYSTWLIRHGFVMACSVAGMIVIAAAVQPHPGVIARVASFAPLRWAGLVSYGVYLYHWPIFVWLTPERTHLDGWNLFALQIAVTFAVAVASYFFVEQPIRTGTGWPIRVKIAVPVASALLLIVFLLAATSGGIADSPDKAIGSKQTQSEPGGPKPTRIMVVGNSVGYFVALEGFAKVDTRPPTEFFNVTAPGCSLPGTELFAEPSGKTTRAFTKACDLKWTEMAERLNPDIVVFMRDGSPPFLYKHNDKLVNVCSQDFHQWYSSTLASNARFFASRGATFVLVTSVPDDKTPVLPDLGDVFPRAEYVQSVKCGNDIMRDVAKAHPNSTKLVDLEQLLCTAPGKCATTRDGTVLREDGNHFTGAGARSVAVLVLDGLGISATVPG